MTQCSERARGRRLDGWLLALGLPLAWLLAGAHLWRAGEGGALLFCLLWGLLCLRRAAWMRPVTVVLLLALAGRWFFTAGRLVQLRIIMEMPWLRLACILTAVAVMTLGVRCWSGDAPAGAGLSESGGMRAHRLWSFLPCWPCCCLCC